MIKTISLKCPECNASLSVDEELKQCFCQYCGAKILIDDGSTTHTYRQVDEARIKEAEVKQLLELKKLEIEEAKRIAKENSKKNKIKLAATSVVVGIIIFVVGEFLGYQSGDGDSPFYMMAFMSLFLIFGPIFLFIDGDNKDK